MADPKDKTTVEVEENTEIREIGALDAAVFPCLRVVAGPGRGAIYPLQPGTNLVGRSDMAHVMLDDSSISRNHAELDVREEGALVRDLDSRNGTQVQGVAITSDTPIMHGQRLKVGIYDFQYLTEEAEMPAEDEPPQPPPESATEAAGAETVVEDDAPTVDEAPPEEMPPQEEVPAEVPPEMPPEVPPEATEQPPVPEAAAEAPPKPPGKLGPLLAVFKRIPRRWYFISVGLLVVAALAYGAVSYFTGGPSGPPEIPTKPITTPDPQAIPSDVKLAVPEYVPVFLDFSAAPISAEVFFGDESVGRTPFRMSAHLKYGKTYEVKAKFRLEEIDEVVEQKQRIALGKDQQVIPVNFAGEIGHMKIKALPRGIDLYLEAFFASDPHQAKPIKFNEVIFGKPIYLPFGRYVMELRQSRKLSASKTFINEVVYRREFVIDKDQGVYEVEVKAAELSVFPAKINTVPPEATLIVDGKELGPTPFEGDLAVGSHKLMIRKEGYFPHEQEIRVDLNTPFEADIALKTSEAGQRINEARIKIRQRRYKEAINLLINALKENPTTKEVAETHYLIGQANVFLKNYPDARDYFIQAMRHQEYRYPARLGIAQLHYAQGERVKALQILTEVLISAKRKDLRSDAGKLFQQISPFKSVLYVMTEPEGADVIVNDKKVAVKTPLLLHDLLVGAYRLYFSLPGYEPHHVKVDIGVSEFKPVTVKLQPIKLAE